MTEPPPTPAPLYTGWQQNPGHHWRAVVTAETMTDAWDKLLALERVNGAALMVRPTGERPGKE